MKPKQLVLPASALALSVMLTACPGAPPPPTPSVAASATTVVGTVQDWTGGAATVVLGTPTNVLASADLSAAGAFTLTLPPASALGAVLAPATTNFAPEQGCQGSLSSSDPATQGYAFSALDVMQAGTNVTEIVALTGTPTNTTSDGGTVVLNGNEWVYVDRPTTLSGSVTCQYASTGLSSKLSQSVNTSLSAGWNVLKVTGTSVVTSSPTSFSSTTDLQLSGGTDGPSVWTDLPPDGTTPLSLAKSGQAKLPSLPSVLDRLPLFRK